MVGCEGYLGVIVCFIEGESDARILILSLHSFRDGEGGHFCFFKFFIHGIGDIDEKENINGFAFLLISKSEGGKKQACEAKCADGRHAIGLKCKPILRYWF